MNQNVLYPNQPAGAPPRLHFCFKCRWEGRTVSATCPNCGRGLYSQTNVRVRGVLLAFIGLFLSGFMSVIAFFVAASLRAAAQDPRRGAQFNGEEHALFVIYMIFGSVIAMGATITLAGLWQLIFGRRNMVLIWIFFGLLIVTYFVTHVFRGLAQ